MSETSLRIVLSNPEQAKQAIGSQLGPYCRDLWARGVERVSVLAEPEEDERTIRQLRFYWGVVLKETSEQGQIGGEKYTPDAWHELGKRLHLPRKHKKTRVAGRRRPVVTTSIGSTQGLSVKKMSLYLDKFMAMAATEYGVQFSLRRWEEFQ